MTYAYIETLGRMQYRARLCRKFVQRGKHQGKVIAS